MFQLNMLFSFDWHHFTLILDWKWTREHKSPFETEINSNFEKTNGKAAIIILHLPQKYFVLLENFSLGYFIEKSKEYLTVN